MSSSSTTSTDVDTTAEEIGTDLTPAEVHTPTTLFRTDDPVEVVERASRVADALKSVLDKQGLTANIQGKRHVLVEGWTTLGAMVGVTAVPAWTRALDGDAPTGKTFGYEARVEARTLDGRVIGAAEAMCTRSEGRWKSADDYAIRSMAQTRATSKALRGPLGFVVTLAGYESTPAEEIPRDSPAPSPATPAVQQPSHGVTARPPQQTRSLATGKQKGLINARADEQGFAALDLLNLLRAAGGAENPLTLDTDAAQAKLRKALDRLPADLVDAVLEGIAARAHEPEGMTH